MSRGQIWALRKYTYTGSFSFEKPYSLRSSSHCYRFLATPALKSVWVNPASSLLATPWSQCSRHSAPYGQVVCVSVLSCSLHSTFKNMRACLGNFKRLNICRLDPG